MSARARLFVLAAVFTAVVTALVLTFASGAPRALRALGGVPTDFAYDVVASGAVESVRPLPGPRAGCEVRIAVWDWINLSRGFPPDEIPRTDDRFRLRGDARSCDALALAMASTDDHVSFRAGKARGRWYLVQPPAAAVGCGGLASDWSPGVVRRFF